MLFKIFSLLFFSRDKSLKIRHSLLNQHTFDYTEDSKADSFLFFREIKYLFNRLNLNSKKECFNGVGIFILSDTHKTKSLNFINSVDEIDFVLTKDDLIRSKNFFERFFMLFIISIISLVTLPLSGLEKFNKLNLILFSRHFINAMIIGNRLKNKCKKLYYFHTHDPDANLNISLLEHLNIEVIAIPNSNPLFMYNSNLIAKNYFLTLGYQIEEFNFFYKRENKSFIFQEIPFLKFYYNDFIKKRKKLCYYSHCSWLRILKNQNLPNFNDVLMELKLLEGIKKMKLLRKYQVTVCLHPKEKATKKIHTQSKEYYKNIFGNNVKFYKDTSYNSFNEYEVGFGSLTSILFERIQCAHKTLIFFEKLTSFPLPNSKFNNFLTDNLSKLESRIDKLIFLDDDYMKIENSIYTYLNK
jgi:hypothetical protein